LTPLTLGDRVRVHLDPKLGVPEGWYTGVIVRIDPYSDHRSFYWVELDPDAQALLGIPRISVLNPKNIQKLAPEP
jgi:hypothetical protein